MDPDDPAPLGIWYTNFHFDSLSQFTIRETPLSFSYQPESVKPLIHRSHCLRRININIL